MNLIIAWEHTKDRTRIYVYPDHKRRVLYSHVSNSYPDVDEWPILWRRDVATLTDAEWIASPGDEWRQIV
jgi:hypothetical protein